MKDNKKKKIGLVILLSVIIGLMFLAMGLWKRIEPVIYIGKAVGHTASETMSYLQTRYPLIQQDIWQSEHLSQKLHLKDFAIGSEDKGLIDFLMGDIGIELDVATSGEQMRGKAYLEVLQGVAQSYEFYKDEKVTGLLSPDTNGQFRVVEQKLTYTQEEQKELISPVVKVLLSELGVEELEIQSEEEGNRQFKVYLSEEGIKLLLEEYMTWLLDTDTLKQHLYLLHGEEMTPVEVDAKLVEAKVTFSDQIAQLQLAKGLEALIVIDQDQIIQTVDLAVELHTAEGPIHMIATLDAYEGETGNKEVAIQVLVEEPTSKITGHLSYIANGQKQGEAKGDQLTLTIDGVLEKPITVDLEIRPTGQGSESFGLDLAISIGEKMACALEGDGQVILSEGSVAVHMKDVLLKLIHSKWGIELDMMNADLSYEAKVIPPTVLTPEGIETNN